jgi:hypothetical protein
MVGGLVGWMVSGWLDGEWLVGRLSGAWC